MSPILKIPKSTKSLHPTADDATMKTRFTIQLSLGLGCGLHTVEGGWGRAPVEEYTVLYLGPGLGIRSFAQNCSL